MKKRVLVVFLVSLFLIITIAGYANAENVSFFEDLLDNFKNVLNTKINSLTTSAVVGGGGGSPDPQVSISSPINNAQVTTSQITVTGTSTSSTRVNVRVNPGSWQLASGTSSWTVNLNLVPGINLIEAQSCYSTSPCSTIKNVNVNYTVPVDCNNECFPEEKRCISGISYKRCGNFDYDSCLEFGGPQSCGANQICEGNQCLNVVQTESGTCTSDCNPGQRRCNGNGYQTCENVVQNGIVIEGCYRYNNIIACSLTCENGFCSSPQPTCWDGTPLNGCSLTKPLYCSNGELLEKCQECGCFGDKICSPDGSCIQKKTVEQSLDLSLINNAPFVNPIEPIKLKEDEEVNLDLNNYVYDKENDKIKVTFKDNFLIYDSELIRCKLVENFLKCDPPKTYDQKISLSFLANDGKKTSDFSIDIRVMLERKGNKPIANAGGDVLSYINSVIVLDASKSYDVDDDLMKKDDSYVWYENEIEIGRGINLKLKYNTVGLHRIKLIVTDDNGLTSEDEVKVNIRTKTKCLGTNTIYFPQDTICDTKWPQGEGELIEVNSKDYSCNLIEVCDESIDYIIEDSINCCSGNVLGNPKATSACNFANKYSDDNSKTCQALYLIKSLGAAQVYMQDYFEAEMCCRGYGSLCSNLNYLYTANPIPNTEGDLSNIQCYNTPENNPFGEWISDTQLDKNNIALFDAPAHVSLNILNTGTCNDYSFALTTLLRKIGYTKDEIYTVTSDDHAYNLIKFPLDKKYTIFDTTGNNEPPIVLGSIPYDYDYCGGIRRCYNDNGEFSCPSLEKINGCEKIKRSISKETSIKSKETGKETLNVAKSLLEYTKKTFWD